MKSEQQIRKAKACVVEKAGEAPWFAGIGVARLAEGIGIVISVRSGCRDDAEKLLSDLMLPVPFEIREVGPIKAR